MSIKKTSHTKFPPLRHNYPANYPCNRASLRFSGKSVPVVPDEIGAPRCRLADSPGSLTMKPHRQAPATRPTKKREFRFLFGAAWLCVGALVKWDASWLYVLLGLTLCAALWVGRRQPALVRVLLLLALVFPAWKLVDQW